MWPRGESFPKKASTTGQEGKELKRRGGDEIKTKEGRCLAKGQEEMQSGLGEETGGRDGQKKNLRGEKERKTHTRKRAPNKI